jgi:hypothetical protein
MLVVPSFSRVQQSNKNAFFLDCWTLGGGGTTFLGNLRKNAAPTSQKTVILNYTTVETYKLT